MATNSSKRRPSAVWVLVVVIALGIAIGFSAFVGLTNVIEAEDDPRADSPN